MSDRRRNEFTENLELLKEDQENRRQERQGLVQDPKRGLIVPIVTKPNFEKYSDASSPTKTVFGVKRVSMANQINRQSTTEFSVAGSVNDRARSINATQTGETGGTETGEQWIVSQGNAEKVSTTQIRDNQLCKSNDR